MNSKNRSSDRSQGDVRRQRKRVLTLPSALCLLYLALMLMCAPLQAATFTVTSAADGTTAGGCGGDSCTLSDAIAAANLTPTLDRIEFNLAGTGPFSFAPIPRVSQPVFIDGYSQPGATANTARSGTNAEFTIRFASTLFFDRFAEDSTVSGIEFMMTTGSGAVQNAAHNLRVLGCLFRENLHNSILAYRKVVVGSPAVRDRNRFAARGSASGAAIHLASNSLGFSSNSVVVNNIFGRSANLENVVDIGMAIRVARPSNVQIGGVGTNEENIFSGASSAAAVHIISSGGNSPPVGISVRGNRFVYNTGIAIDLDDHGENAGVTPNDIDDIDQGTNGGQNFPVIQNAVASPASIAIGGTLDRPATDGPRVYDLDFYVSATCHPSGNGEGDAFFATRQFLSTDPAAETFSFIIPTTLIPPNSVLTATATEVATGNTSEFSTCVAVIGADASAIFQNGFE